MVSPVDKNGGDVAGEGVSVIAAADGSAVAYMARGSFGDTIGSGIVGQTQYVARRGADGWWSHGIAPTPNHEVQMGGLAFDTVVTNFSDDVRRAVVSAFDLPAVVGEVSDTNNLYSLDTLTRDLRLISVAPVGPYDAFVFFGDFLFPTFGGVSRDSRHIAFKACAHLLTGVPGTGDVTCQDGGISSVYEWDDGTLRLVSILPEGTVAPGGAVLAPERYRETVSPDGSRVLFMSPPSGGQLYARVDHERTVWVSEPETRDASPAPEAVLLQQVTGDSRHIIFTTTSRLRDEDTNDGSDLYLYSDSAEPGDDSNLTLITNTGDVNPEPGAGTAVIGSSDDAREVYFYSGGQILLWTGDATRVVASNVEMDLRTQLHLSATVSSPGAGRVTPDGEHLAFMVSGTISSGGPNPLVGTSNGYRQLYLYDKGSDQLRCVSCPSNGAATATASVIPDVTAMWPRANIRGTRPSFLSSDGEVFFSTAAPLVMEDVNGVTDAYAFDPASGEASLVSTGKGAAPAAFVDASATGDDVFFVTRQRLVKADRDEFVDLYDARVGGGFADAAEPAAPCVGDVCQGAAAPGPDKATLGSLAFEEDGSRSQGEARFRLLRFRNLSGGHAMLGLKTAAPGTIRWSGRGLRLGSRKFARAGRHGIRLTLTPVARGRLVHHGAIHVRVRLSFAAVSGSKSVRTTSLTFKSSSSKKGR